MGKDFYMDVLKGYSIMTLAASMVYGFTWKALILYPVMFVAHVIIKILKIAIKRFADN
jgi:hypothetical protein